MAFILETDRGGARLRVSGAALFKAPTYDAEFVGSISDLEPFRCMQMLAVRVLVVLRELESRLHFYMSAASSALVQFWPVADPPTAEDLNLLHLNILWTADIDVLIHTRASQLQRLRVFREEAPTNSAGLFVGRTTERFAIQCGLLHRFSNRHQLPCNTLTPRRHA